MSEVEVDILRSCFGSGMFGVLSLRCGGLVNVEIE